MIRENDIKKLLATGKIKGFKISGKKKGKAIPGKKSKALEWLDKNIHFFCQDNHIRLEKEHRFDNIKKWRFDYAMPALKIAVEFEGGIYLQRSGHNTAKHYTKDTEKYNRAAVLGWRVIRVTAINYKTVLETLKQMI